MLYPEHGGAGELIVIEDSGKVLLDTLDASVGADSQRKASIDEAEQISGISAKA